MKSHCSADLDCEIPVALLGCVKYQYSHRVPHRLAESCTGRDWGAKSSLAVAIGSLEAGRRWICLDFISHVTRCGRQDSAYFYVYLCPQPRVCVGVGRGKTGDGEDGGRWTVHADGER